MSVICSSFTGHEHRNPPSKITEMVSNDSLQKFVPEQNQQFKSLLDEGGAFYREGRNWEAARAQSKAANLARDAYGEDSLLSAHARCREVLSCSAWCRQAASRSEEGRDARQYKIAMAACHAAAEHGLKIWSNRRAQHTLRVLRGSEAWFEEEGEEEGADGGGGGGRRRLCSAVRAEDRFRLGPHDCASALLLASQEFDSSGPTEVTVNYARLAYEVTTESAACRFTVKLEAAPLQEECLVGDPKQMAPFLESVALLYYTQMQLDTHNTRTQQHKIAMTRLLFENKWLAKKVRGGGEEEKPEGASGASAEEEESDEVHCAHPACSVWWYKDATLEDATLCVVCNQAYYCSEACQVKHYFTHRPWCKAEKERRASLSAAAAASLTSMFKSDLKISKAPTPADRLRARMPPPPSASNSPITRKPKGTRKSSSITGESNLGELDPRKTNSVRSGSQGSRRKTLWEWFTRSSSSQASRQSSEGKAKKGRRGSY